MAESDLADFWGRGSLNVWKSFGFENSRKQRQALLRFLKETCGFADFARKSSNIPVGQAILVTIYEACITSQFFGEPKEDKKKQETIVESFARNTTSTIPPEKKVKIDNALENFIVTDFTPFVYCGRRRI